MKRRIVAEVKRRLKGVGEVPYGDDTPFGDDVESAVEVGSVRAGMLRQSMLKSAFEGRLSTDSEADKRIRWSR